MKLNNILVLIRNVLEYDRIDHSEGIGVNKCKDASKNVVYASFIIF